MKKLSLFIISALFVFALATQARAESSPTTFAGNVYTDEQVFIRAYNNSGAIVSENQVVILDTSATAGTTLGSYFTITTSTDSSYVMGVTDQQVAKGDIGRICVRGPHKVQITANPTAGQNMGTGSTYGKATASTATTTATGILGTALAASTSGSTWWVWVNPHTI